MAGKPQLKFLKKVLHLVDNLPCPEGVEGEKDKKYQRFSLPQSAALTAPSSEGAMIGTPIKHTDKYEFDISFRFGILVQRR